MHNKRRHKKIRKGLKPQFDDTVLKKLIKTESNSFICVKDVRKYFLFDYFVVYAKSSLIA
jgi:hypothetical protein